MRYLSVLAITIPLAACSHNTVGLLTPEQATANRNAVIAECWNVIPMSGTGNVSLQQTDRTPGKAQYCLNAWVKAQSDLDLSRRYSQRGMSMFSGRDFSYGPQGRYGGTLPRGSWGTVVY